MSFLMDVHRQSGSQLRDSVKYQAPLVLSALTIYHLLCMLAGGCAGGLLWIFFRIFPANSYLLQPETTL